MSTDLFPEVRGESPRLAWIKRHDLHTQLCPDPDEHPWACWAGKLSAALDAGTVGDGPTEDDAIADWARKSGALLWNEEPRKS